MRTTKAVTIVHPDSRIRIALRGLLEAHGCTVSTDFSCADLLAGKSDVRPDLILADRRLVEHEGLDVLSLLRRRWDESEIVFLPDTVTDEAGATALATQLLRIVDRLLQLRTTSDILAV